MCFQKTPNSQYCHAIDSHHLIPSIHEISRDFVPYDMTILLTLKCTVYLHFPSTPWFVFKTGVFTCLVFYSSMAIFLFQQFTDLEFTTLLQNANPVRNWLLNILRLSLHVSSSLSHSISSVFSWPGPPMLPPLSQNRLCKRMCNWIQVLYQEHMLFNSTSWRKMTFVFKNTSEFSDIFFWFTFRYRPDSLSFCPFCTLKVYYLHTALLWSHLHFFPLILNKHTSYLHQLQSLCVPSERHRYWVKWWQ